MNFPSIRFTRTAMALGIKALIVLCSTIAIYFQDLTMIANDALRSDLMSYVLVIPILFVYLIYRKRKMLRAATTLGKTSTDQVSSHVSEIVGALLCLTAFLVYWHGSYTFYPLEYHMTSLPFFAAGLVLIMFGARTLKVLIFPIAFLLFLTPPPAEIVSIAGASIATLSSDVSYSILKTIGMPISQISEYGAPALVVVDPSGSQVSFVVGTASSGIYSIIGFGIFAVFIMYIARGPAWKKATIFLACLPIIYVITILRIMGLVALGYWQGVNVAWDIFHLLGASVLIFLGSIILLSISEKICKLRVFTSLPAKPCTTCSSNEKTREDFCPTCGKIMTYHNISLSKRDISKIVIVIILTSLVVTLSVPVLALSVQPPQVLTKTIGNEETTATEILPKIGDYSLRFAYRDTQFEEIAGRDRALLYAYNRTNPSSQTVFVAIEIGASRATWHSWEASVIIWPQQHGRPAQGVQLDLKEIQLLSNPPLIGKYFAFRQTASNTTQVVLYWMETALFETGSRTESKYVKMSLIIFPKSSDDIQETETLLLPFASAIIGYWQPLKTWSQVNLTIAQNGASLATIPITLLTTILLHGLIRQFRERKSNLRIFNQLDVQEEKLILQAAYQASKKDQPITSAIVAHYQKLTGQTIETEKLTEKLKQAEKLGLVKRDIASREDQPVLVWKSQTPTSRHHFIQTLTQKLKSVLGSARKNRHARLSF